MDAAEQEEEGEQVLEEDEEWGLRRRGKKLRDRGKEVGEKGGREGRRAGVGRGRSGEEEGFDAQRDGGKDNDWKEGRATKPAVIGRVSL